jgi:alpha-tubulin suppressor-like RCC1 family protein
MGSSGNNLQPAPRFCTYGIIIKEISCGAEHSAFITNDNFVYTIGSNSYGQLGTGDMQVKQKNSPVLVEAFLNKDTLGVQSVACGYYHTVVSTLSGHVFSWGKGADG